jgi:hypothetical protein
MLFLDTNGCLYQLRKQVNEKSIWLPLSSLCPSRYGAYGPTIAAESAPLRLKTRGVAKEHRECPQQRSPELDGVSGVAVLGRL